MNTEQQPAEPWRGQSSEELERLEGLGAADALKLFGGREPVEALPQRPGLNERDRQALTRLEQHRGDLPPFDLGALSAFAMRADGEDARRIQRLFDKHARG